MRTEQLGQSDIVAGAYAATVLSGVAILQTLNTEITGLETEVEAYFGLHPDIEIYSSLPGLGPILGARVLAEFGDARPLRRRQSPQELRRHRTHHQTVGKGEDGARPLHPQRSARQRTRPPSRRSHAARPLRPRLLRRTPRPRPRPPRSPAPTRQPTRRHPPRLP